VGHGALSLSIRASVEVLVGLVIDRWSVFGAIAPLVDGSCVFEEAFHPDSHLLSHGENPS
jgi:hypothetical protein